jgi:hypothetical protein
MRLTGLGQYAKGLAHHNPIEATALLDRLERIKWRRKRRQSNIWRSQ